MASTPTTVRMPVKIPLYLKTPQGEYVEVVTVESMIDVTVETVKTPRWQETAWDLAASDAAERALNEDNT